MCVCMFVWLLSPALLGNSWLLISDQGQLVLISCTLYIELFVVHSLSDHCCSLSFPVHCSSVSHLQFGSELFSELLLRNLARCSWKMGSFFCFFFAVHDLSLLPIVVPALLRTLSAPTVFPVIFMLLRFGLLKINFCALATESQVYIYMYFYVYVHLYIFLIKNKKIQFTSI